MIDFHFSENGLKLVFPPGFEICDILQYISFNHLPPILHDQKNHDEISYQKYIYISTNSLCKAVRGNTDVLLVKTNLDSSFPSAQFHMHWYTTPYCVDRNTSDGGL